MQHVFLILLLGLISLLPAAAQDTYSLSWKVEVPTITVDLGTVIPAYILDRKAEHLTKADIDALEASNVWKLDRPVTKRWHPGSALASDVLLYTAMASPGLLFINEQVRNERFDVPVMYGETMLVTAGLTALTKVLAQRKRPYVYNPNAPLDKKLHNDARHSFFSGHTSFTAASMFFTAKVFSDLNPDSRWKPMVWTFAAAVPFAMGTLRVTAGKHFFTDVIVGYLVGAGVGMLVPYLHTL